MHGYFDYYSPSEASHEAGQIWADGPVYLPPRHGIKITRVNEEDDRDLDWTIGGRTQEIFDHPPIHSLRLESTEGAVMCRTKRDRPVVILGGTNATDAAPGQSATHHDILWVVPIYGADQYDEQLRRRIRIYDFANYFYLPASRELDFDEGFARLDHAQPVYRTQLRRHRGMSLTEEALDALVEWFIAFTTGRLDEDSLILEYRKEQTADN